MLLHTLTVCFFIFAIIEMYKSYFAGELHGERRSSVSLKKPAVPAVSFASVAANHLKQTKSLDIGNSEASVMNDPNRRVSAVEEFTAPTLILASRKTSCDQTRIDSIGNGRELGSTTENGDGAAAPSYSVRKRRL